MDHIILSSQKVPDAVAVNKSTIIETQIKVEENKNDSTVTKIDQTNELGKIIFNVEKK